MVFKKEINYITTQHQRLKPGSLKYYIVLKFASVYKVNVIYYIHVKLWFKTYLISFFIYGIAY